MSKFTGMHTEHMRASSANRRQALINFPRKKKGTYERTAARAKDRNMYRKDFKRIKKQ